MTNYHSECRLINKLKSGSKAASLIVALVGFIVVLGWFFNIQILKSILPDWVAMKPNTALGFMLSGLALNMLQSTGKIKRRMAQGSSLAVTMIGTLTMSEYLFGWNLGIDQLLFLDTLGAIATSVPLRMAPSVAFNFILIGLALFLSVGLTIRYKLVQLLTLTAALISLQILIELSYGSQAVYEVQPVFGLAFFSGIALHTALTFLILCAGLLCADPNGGWMSLVISQTVGGITARVLLPGAIAVPFGLGWLEALGEQTGWFDTAIGRSWHVTGNMIAFVGLIWYCAKRLYSLDIKRRQVEASLRDAYAELEMKVQLRTQELSQANQELKQEIAERRRTDAALRESERNLRAIVDNAPAIIYLKDLQGRIQLINRQFEAVFGISPQQVIGKLDSELFSQEEAAVFQSNDRQIMTTGEAMQVGETVLVSGELRSYISVKFPLYDADHTLYGLGGISTDITELRQSEERFRRAIVDAPLPIILHAEDGEVLQINRVWTEITGYSAEDIPTVAKWIEKAYDDQKEEIQTGIARLHHLQHRIYEGEYTIKTRTGETRIWDFYSAPLGKLPDGRSLVISTALDVTERKQAEAALQKYKDIFQFAEHALATSKDSVLELTNPAFARMHGYTVEELLGKPILDLFPPECHAQIYAFIQKLNETGHMTYESKHIRKNGTVFPVLIDATAVKDEQGNLLYRIFNIFDITERQQTENALRESEARARARAEELEIFMEAVPAAVWIAHDPECHQMTTNGAAYKMMRRTPDAIMTATPSTGEYPFQFKIQKDGQDIPSHELPMQQAGRTGQSVEANFEFVFDDADVRFITGRAVPLRDESGNVRGVIGAFWDITTLKQGEEALRQSEERFRHAILNAPLPMMLYTENGEVLEINDVWQENTGYTLEEIPTIAAWTAKAYGDRQAQVLTEIARAFPLTQRTAMGEYAITTRSGEIRIWDFYAAPLGQLSDGRRLVIVTALDVSDRKRTEDALREQAHLLDLTYEAIFVRNASNAITYWNRSAEELYGWTNAAATGQIPQILLNTEYPPTSPNVDEILHQQGRWEGELIHTRRDGTKIVVASRQVLMRDAAGRVKGVLEVNRDITQRKRVEEQLLQNAFYDGLTGLPNRALFMERLKHALQQTKRQENYLFAVMFLDLDRFKVINDSLGHLLGDEFLLAIAQRLEVCIRATDTVARLGGDEFTILLDGIHNVSDTIRVVERIQQQLALPLLLNGQEVFTTASIGIALSSTVNYDQPEDLLRDADTAMYRAKAMGRSRYELFNPDMYANALAKLQLETDLRRAIERQEFRVYYQPIVSLSSGRILSFEALLRWQHPERGLLYPADFIPLAEETGLIVEIGYWALHEACRQMQAWRENQLTKSLKKISVNLSVKQFSQPDLIAQIEQILHSTGLDASQLVLEITESAIVENGDEATATLLQLRNLGIELSIDDFGTGYSSLGRLYSFPISVLKIDRSFVSPMDANNRNLEIIEIIVTLAHKLGVDVVTEGVETSEQLELMRKFNCEYGQGYFFSRPLDSSAAAALISADPQW